MRPAPRAGDARRAARGGLATALYAGTSGFSYPGWKGRFYPATLAGSKMLEFYAQRLNGVELNGSFYRMPPPAALAKWVAQTPAAFRFCMKANRGLTYSAEGFDRAGLARILAERLAPLGGRLGPVLLQFPPVRRFDPALLDALLGALVTPVAAEFRHESWFRDETYSILREHGGALVITDEEKWPRAPRVELGSTAYYRLRRGYSARALRPWIEEVRSALGSHDAVHVYFKHDPESPALAERLMKQALKSGGASRLA
ncbi:MAG TPA: DUF72 domain-containing protein [Patescibacteria group bacterium]|nr:DUF72 domain-containing protein [Patescibacteria group bacterium]